MTQDLYRKEALDHVTQRLYGEVVLKSPPASWVITLIILAVMGLFIALLFLTRIEDGVTSQSLLRWLISRLT